MRLTKTTSHAVRILIDCAAASGELLKVADIAERLGISQLNVFKIVHLLSRAGFIEAERGRYGGVRLSRPPSEIRIGEVVRAMESTEIKVAGAEKRARSSRSGAKPNLNIIFDDALEAFISVLDQHTLADLASKSRPSIGSRDAKRTATHARRQGQ